MQVWIQARWKIVSGYDNQDRAYYGYNASTITFKLLLINCTKCVRWVFWAIKVFSVAVKNFFTYLTVKSDKSAIQSTLWSLSISCRNYTTTLSFFLGFVEIGNWKFENYNIERVCNRKEKIVNIWWKCNNGEIIAHMQSNRGNTFDSERGKVRNWVTWVWSSWLHSCFSDEIYQKKI